MKPLRTQSPDTTQEAERIQFEIRRAMDDPQKFWLASELSDSVRRLAEVGLRERFPDASDAEIRMRLIATWLDREAMVRWYGWDPRDHQL